MGMIIKAATAATLLLGLAAPAMAANFATCVLDKLPGTANEVAAQAIYQLCRSEHPGGLDAVSQGSGRGIFGFKSGPECTAKQAGDTRSNQAAYMIGRACNRLYNEPVKLAPFNGKLDGESEIDRFLRDAPS